MNTTLSYFRPNYIKGNNSFPDNPKLPEMNNRFEIHTMEWMDIERPSWNTESEKLSRFEIFWIKKGKGVLWFDENTYDITDNIIYCLPPGHYRKCNIEMELEGYYISFAPEFNWLSGGNSVNTLWSGGYDNYPGLQAVTVSTEMQQELEAIAKKMNWEFNNNLNGKMDLLKGLLNIFMIYFSRNLKHGEEQLPSGESELVKKFLALLKKNFINQKMVSDYASQLCVTPNYLNRTVKKATGFTASYHIQQQIILEAKRNFIYSSVSMKEIAYSLGFDNPAHFSKFFKNNCGMNFTEFKTTAIRAD